MSPSEGGGDRKESSCDDMRCWGNVHHLQAAASVVCCLSEFNTYRDEDFMGHSGTSHKQTPSVCKRSKTTKRCNSCQLCSHVELCSGNKDWRLMTHEELQIESFNMRKSVIPWFSGPDPMWCHPLMIQPGPWSWMVRAILNTDRWSKPSCIEEMQLVCTNCGQKCPSSPSHFIQGYFCAGAGTQDEAADFFVTLRPQWHGVRSMLWLKGIY